MFLAPALYGLHAILPGAAMVLMNALGVKLGFSFSAGFFDYVLNFNRATRPLMLIPIGLAYGALYYGVFRFVIVRFDLKTPGREADADPPAARVPASGEEALGFIAALGGPDNVRELAACTTRLRLIVAEPALVDESRLKALGAKGVVRPSLKGVQVVLGPAADRMAGEMRALLERTGALSPTLPPRPEERFAVPAPEGRGGRESSSPQGPDVMALLAALGGPDNVKTLEACASRLRLGVAGAAAIDPAAVRAAGARALAKPSATSVHVVIGPRAEAVAASLRALLAP
jgi:PTS system N-acetylglucosamine-specific IIC component